MTKWLSRRSYEGRHRTEEYDTVTRPTSEKDANGSESLVVLSALLGGGERRA